MSDSDSYFSVRVHPQKNVNVYSHSRNERDHDKVSPDVTANSRSGCCNLSLSLIGGVCTWFSTVILLFLIAGCWSFDYIWEATLALLLAMLSCFFLYIEYHKPCGMMFVGDALCALLLGVYWYLWSTAISYTMEQCQ